MTTHHDTHHDTHDEMPVADGDPRLTAYALGELPEAERAEMSARLLRDPAARAEVEAIRAAADVLREGFAAEAADAKAGGAAPALSPEQRAAIERAARVGASGAVSAMASPARWASRAWLWPLGAGEGATKFEEIEEPVFAEISNPNSPITTRSQGPNPNP